MNRPGSTGFRKKASKKDKVCFTLLIQIYARMLTGTGQGGKGKGRKESE